MTPQDKRTTLGNLSGTTKLDDLKDCDLIIEAIIENLDEKAQTYAALERSSATHTIFCSNTSSLCITELAAKTKRPDRFAGLHFFNPVPLMKLVEVIRGADDERRDLPDGVRVRAVARQGADHRARQARASSSIACWCRTCSTRSAAYEHGLGTLEDIDKGMKLGCGYPMGPFTLLDFVGLDTTYYIANIMFEEYREPAYAPPPLLKRMVLAGRLRPEIRAGLLQIFMIGNPRQRLLVFIVAYNAEKTIQQTLRRIPARLLNDFDVEVLVIDDSSTRPDIRSRGSDAARRGAAIRVDGACSIRKTRDTAAIRRSVSTTRSSGDSISSR